MTSPDALVYLLHIQGLLRGTDGVPASASTEQRPSFHPFQRGLPQSGDHWRGSQEDRTRVSRGQPRDSLARDERLTQRTHPPIRGYGRGSGLGHRRTRDSTPAGGGAAAGGERGETLIATAETTVPGAQKHSRGHSLKQFAY